MNIKGAKAIWYLLYKQATIFAGYTNTSTFASVCAERLRNSHGDVPFVILGFLGFKTHAC